MRIVADFGSLNELAIKGENGRIEIEQKAGTRLGEIEHLEPELVVNFVDVLNDLGIDSFEEAP